MGTPEFAVPSLDILLGNDHPIAAVVTGPDKPRGRGQKLSPTPVKEVALRNNLPLLQPERLRDPDFVDQLRSLAPDIVVVVAFRILPPELLSIPRLGSFNLHASLLPKYRGAAPINWAIINGEVETGVTTFLLEENIDTGNILLQARIRIEPEDNAGTIHDKLAVVGAELVLHTVRLIGQGKAVPKPQDDTLSTPAPKIFKEQCHIDWANPAARTHNLVRGLSPYPGAFSVHNGRVIKLYRTRITGLPATSLPGEVVIREASTILVSSSDMMLEVIELQQEGRKRMGAPEFLRGYEFRIGDRLV
jgi:methionyl-tRNA formyltransferase